jgi:hypothetical protein
MKTATLFFAAALTSSAISAGAVAPTEPPAVDPAAVAALAKMSAFLRTISAFQITVQTQRDDVDEYGQLITLSGEATYKVRRPDAFSISLSLPSQSGQYVYDGKTLTAYDAGTASYRRFPAPPTIRATLELAKQKYGATVPLEDLFSWSEGDDRAKALTSAHFIGKTRVAGQAASQYAFRQPGVDWQIWIADGNTPLPLRIAIVSSRDPARPQFQADLAWNTAPKFAANAWTFSPPPNARAIAYRPTR